MTETENNNNKKGALAPLLKTIDFLLAKLGYNENSRIRKKLEPAILTVTIILLGLIVAIFSNLVEFDIYKFIGTFVGIPTFLVIGSWIVSAFNITEKTKKKLGVTLIIFSIIAIAIYLLYDNRQKVYNVINEINNLQTKNDTINKHTVIKTDSNTIIKPIIDNSDISNSNNDNDKKNEEIDFILKGTIVDTDGEPIEKAIVELISGNNTISLETGDNGYYDTIIKSDKDEIKYKIHITYNALQKTTSRTFKNDKTASQITIE